MTTSSYIALIHKDIDSDFGVSFPDLPGCVTAGTSLDEALAMAKEALALHIEDMLENGEEIPEPTAADKIDRDGALLIAAIETLDLDRIERVTVDIPAIVLAQLDAFAARQGKTRSSLIVEAVDRLINQDRIVPLAMSAEPEQQHGSTGRSKLALAKYITEIALLAIQEALADHPSTNAEATENIDDLIEPIRRLMDKLELYSRLKVG